MTTTNRPATTALVFEHRCEACHGEGLLYSPVWRRWHEREGEARLAWRADHGGDADWYASPAYVALRLERPAGPQEDPCGECEGIGSIPTELGHQLLGFLRRHLNT